MSATASGSEFVFTIANERQLVEPALQVITPQATLAVASSVAQLDNIRQRLDNLRARQNPTVIEGLKVSYNGQALPSMGAFALAPTDKDGKPIRKRWRRERGSGPVRAVRRLRCRRYRHRKGERCGYPERIRFSHARNLGRHRLPIRGQSCAGASLGLVRADADVTGNSGSQDVKGYSFSLYGSIVPAPNAYIDLALNYGRNRYDGTRQAGSPTLLSVPIEYSSDPHGNQFGASASIGYQFYRAELTLAPYGRVEYIDATIDSFQESGGPGALKIGKQRYKTTVLSLGGQASYAISMPWGVLMPYGRAEYQYQAGTSGKGRSTPSCCSIPPSAQSCRQPRSTRSTGNSALGASMVLPGGMSGYFNYQHLFRQG